MLVYITLVFFSKQKLKSVAELKYLGIFVIMISREVHQEQLHARSEAEMLRGCLRRE